MAEYLANLYEFFGREDMSRDPDATRKLDPETPDLEQWIIQNKPRLQKLFQ